MITAGDIKVGNVINYQNGIWKVVKTMHVKPGKGGAFMQTELRNLITGTKTDIRFRTEENVERIDFVEFTASFLYDENNMMEFMDMSTFEQISVSKDLIGDKKAFIKEEMSVKIAKAGDTIVDVILPENVSILVSETQPYIRGQTITSSFKPAVLANGLTIQVPQFIEAGDVIIVKPETLEYVERAKK